MADYGDLISAAEQQYGIRSGLLHALINRGEASGVNAVSPKGAGGIAQLMPGTAADLGVKNRFDPAQGIDGGARYLKQMLDTFGGDETKAVAAYNAGPGAVKKYGGVPPFKETQAYVKRVVGGGSSMPSANDVQAYFSGQGADPAPAKGGQPSPDDVLAYFGQKTAATKAPQATMAGMKALAYGKAPTTGQDVKKSAVSGLFETMLGADPQNPGLGFVNHAMEQAAGVASGMQDLLHGKMPQLKARLPANPVADIGAARVAAAGQSYTPRTTAGEWAKTAGQMAPAALMPASIPQRIANVVLPTVGTEGAGQLARKMGAGPNIEQAARLLGGVAGGVAANTRLAPVDGALPATESKAMKYVSSLAPKDKLPQLSSAPDALTAAEAIGQPGKTALGALARRPGTTGDALNAEVSARQEGRPGRLLDAFANVSGVHPDAAAGNLQTLVDAGRAKAAPLYEQAYAVGGIDTPKLQALAQRPSVKAAMAKAVKIAAEDGKDPTALGFQTAPEGSVSVKAPTAETWDYVKRGLDDVIGDYRDPTSGKLNLDTLGRKTVSTLEELRNELKTANPAYGDALAASGDYLSAESAFKSAGQDVFNTKLTERDLAAKFAKLSESEREAYKGGVANRFYDLAQNGRLDPKILRTPRVQAKLRSVLGPDAAKKLIDLGSQEGDMLAFERRYAPGAGSITQEMKAAMDAQDGAGRGAQIATDFVGNLHRGPVKAAGSAIGRQMQSLADVLGSTRGLSEQSRNIAGEKLMLSPAELAKAIQEYRSAPKGMKLMLNQDPRFQAFIGTQGR